MDTIIEQCRQFLALSEPEKALATIEKLTGGDFTSQKASSAAFLEVLGQILVENSKLSEACTVYRQLISQFPEEEEALDGYFNLGQLLGDKKGINYLEKGWNLAEKLLKKSEADATPAARQVLVSKYCQALFSAVEIYMTELCMEDEAQQKCEEYIQKALLLDNNSAEAWSLYASYSISAQMPQEARAQVEKAWSLFSQQKQQLEDSADSFANNGATNGVVADVSSEYIALIQPLLTLSKLALEVELFELAAAAASSVHDLADDLVEPYYIEAFSYVLAAKALQFDLLGLESENRLEALQEMELQIEEGRGKSAEITEYIKQALLALSSGSRVYDETCDEEVREQMGMLLEMLGGKEAMKRVEKEVEEKAKEEVEGEWGV